MGAIRQLRRSGSSAEPKALNFGLSPVGFGDGGINRAAEYTNNYWLLGGLKAAIKAAVWLGKSDDARQWSREYDNFQWAFRAAIHRDAKTEPRSGARYIPVIMGGNRRNSRPGDNGRFAKGSTLPDFRRE